MADLPADTTQATVDLDTLDVFVGGSISGTLSDAYFVEADASGSAIVDGGDGYCLDLWTFSQVFDDPHGWTGSAGSAAGAATPHLGRAM